MDTSTLRETYIRYFVSLGHKVIPSAPLLPENDPTVLFTTAGMHPLVPFLLGEAHPMGKRLVNYQRCIRTNDIEEVGDLSHLTFFEMLGNWSLGDYFKDDSLAWSHRFLVSELGLEASRLAVTVFAGDSDAPRDDFSAETWRKLGIPAERIFYLPKSENWWGPAGATGPCGPDSEIFYDTLKPDHPGCIPGCHCGRWMEIWNNVFMEYYKTTSGGYHRLSQKNVDTGMGIERTVAVLNGWDDVYQVDTLAPIIRQIERLTGKEHANHPHPFRVIADHIRTATLAIADGALPSNVEAGYVVRRVIRRAVRHGRELGIQANFCGDLAQIVCDLFASVYPHVETHRAQIVEALDREESKFKHTLERGLRELGKVVIRLQANGAREISAEEAFNLYETYGFPLELTSEIAAEAGLRVDEPGFKQQYHQHQALSRLASQQKFKGGLADHTEQTTRLHTATHLLHQALRQVLGIHVRQMDSNITAERLRFDFSHPERLSDEQIRQVEQIVNAQIKRDLPVSMVAMPLEQALASGALAFFGEKYGRQVKVYKIGDFSREVCGGPHVAHTGELGRFKILKQEAVGQGVRRVRAMVET